VVRLRRFGRTDLPQCTLWEVVMENSARPPRSERAPVTGSRRFCRTCEGLPEMKVAGRPVLGSMLAAADDQHPDVAAPALFRSIACGRLCVAPSWLCGAIV
jgi:hypothetical protein